MTSELIERVARALAQADGIQICDGATYALSSYRAGALAAIAAMQADADLERIKRERDQAVEALRAIKDVWVSNNSEGDDYDEGYDDGLKAAHDIANAALASIKGTGHE